MKSYKHLMLVGFFTVAIASYSILGGTARCHADVEFGEISFLFTTNGAWHNYDETSLSYFACTACHGSNVEPEPDPCPPKCHLMNLGTCDGILNGADGGTEPILGESFVGATDYNWDEAGLRKRLRNNRMPPQFPFRLDESNRDGTDLYLDRDPVPAGYTAIDIPGKFKILLNDATQELAYADEAGDSRGNAVGLIGAWVDGSAGVGLSERRGVTYNGIRVRWGDVEAFFTQPNTWFNGSLACIYCHFSNEEPPSYHAMDLSSPQGLMNGADDGTEPILGETAVGNKNYDWEESGLRARLRNNRMPPDAPFDLNELTRDGPVVNHPDGGTTRAVDLIGDWIQDGGVDLCP